MNIKYLLDIFTSLRSLSSGRPTATSKASSSHSAIYCFLFQLTVPSFSLMLSRSWLCLPLLRVPSVFPSLTYFSRQFVRKMWPLQLAFLRFTALGFVPVPLLYVTLLHFSHDRANWFIPFFSSTAFQNSPSISDLLSEMSNFSTIQSHAQYVALS